MLDFILKFTSINMYMKILILQISALGDIIYTLYFVKQLYHNLFDKHNDVKIDWLVKSKNILLENQNEINSVIYNQQNISDNYDYIIDFGTKRHTCYLKYKLSGIKIGFENKKLRKSFISWINDYSLPYNLTISVMNNQLNMIVFLCNLEKINFANKHVVIQHNEKIVNDMISYCEGLHNIIVFNPNASTNKKEVSIDIWSSIFREFMHQNKTCILIGEHFGEKGKILAEIVRKDFSFIRILPKKLDTFYNLSYLISKSECVYTPDTSILHLAEFQHIDVHELFTEYSNHFVKKWCKDN